MYGKSKMDSQCKFAIWLRKLKEGLCINLEGWDEERDGREVQKGGDICIPMYTYMYTYIIIPMADSC